MQKILKDSMNNKEFDDIIKKKLESLNSLGGDDAWDLFKEKWDNESNPDSSIENTSPEDQDLDQKIKMDMQDLRVPFNSKHWIILKEKLELEALFKKKLFVAKCVELLILALLVLGILNLWPIQNEIHQIPVYDMPMVASVPVSKETAEQHKLNVQKNKAKQQLALTQTINKTKVIARSTIPSLSKLMSFNSSGSNGMTSKKETRKPLKSNGSLKSSSVKEFSELFPFLDVKEKNNEERAASNSDATRPLIIAQSLEQNSSLIEIPKRPTGFPELELNQRPKKNKENSYVSFAVGPRVNLINSPFDPVYGFDPYNTINTNFNISAKLHKEIGPLELFAGLGYTNISYEPRLVDEIYEPRESEFNVTTLENIKFKTFNVPLGVRLDLINAEKYQIYTLAGVDINVIADSEYEIQDVPIGSRAPGFAPAPPPPRNSANENAKLSQKDFNLGILSGGSLKDNLFASASVGLGLNMNISSKTGIFLEPKYSHFISSIGIGPNEDKLHGLSIDLGVKYLLN